MTLKDFVGLVRADVKVGRGTAGTFGLITAFVFRVKQLSAQGRGVTKIAAKVVGIPADVFWTKMLMGSDIPGQVRCGPGLILAHGGRVLSVNPRTVLGSRVTIQQHVIVGNNRGRPEAPVIGDDVFLGPRSTVLGGITIGDNAQVGAHAVVLADVPAGSTTVGIPAKLLV